MRKIVERARERIHDHGWVVQGVLSNPPYAYSIGMHMLPEFEVPLPEIMLVGFDIQLAGNLINAAGILMREGNKFADWTQSTDILTSYRVIFREIDIASIERNCGFITHFAERTPRMLQMFIPDRFGAFPWDDTCDRDAQRQYNLDLSYRQ